MALSLRKKSKQPEGGWERRKDYRAPTQSLYSRSRLPVDVGAVMRDVANDPAKMGFVAESIQTYPRNTNMYGQFGNPYKITRFIPPTIHPRNFEALSRMPVKFRHTEVPAYIHADNNGRGVQRDTSSCVSTGKFTKPWLAKSVTSHLSSDSYSYAGKVSVSNKNFQSPVQASASTGISVGMASPHEQYRELNNPGLSAYATSGVSMDGRKPHDAYDPTGYYRTNLGEPVYARQTYDGSHPYDGDVAENHFTGRPQYSVQTNPSSSVEGFVDLTRPDSYSRYQTVRPRASAFARQTYQDEGSVIAARPQLPTKLKAGSFEQLNDSGKLNRTSDHLDYHRSSFTRSPDHRRTGHQNVAAEDVDMRTMPTLHLTPTIRTPGVRGKIREASGEISTRDSVLANDRAQFG